eukprot:CAMPEP_0114545726 /NCGR_PEP_ID=MMETSP0114-20121206/3565_1 /TAXON_ID=31324 /ORGANISM="Goniomonas sp, Strain m" /LENGTH=49 /DNA_ID= /DNA_START= /DNA_END= /DNA_ORIENTATION=
MTRNRTASGEEGSRPFQLQGGRERRCWLEKTYQNDKAHEQEEHRINRWR